MKTIPLISMPRTLLLASLAVCTVLTSKLASAEGASSGGGGDAATEMRIDEIRADILKWINEGGAAGLRFSGDLDLDRYRKEMSEVLKPRAVVIGGITEAEEVATKDPELKVQVDRQPKTCRGFISTRDQLPHVLCKTERFQATSPAEQYRLVHHEYAGLAGTERNQGASSDYRISSQITDYLMPETIFRLSVKKNPSSNKTSRGKSALENVFSDMAGSYKKTSGEFRCPEVLTLEVEPSDVVFKSQMRLIYPAYENLSTGANVPTLIREGSYETDFKSLNNGYGKNRFNTHLDSKSGYVVYETLFKYSDLPGVLRWLESSMWERISMFMKKLPDGTLHLATTYDANGVTGLSESLSRLNCTYQPN